MDYRIYSLNPSTGKIIHATDVIARDDVEAVRHGRAEHDDAPFEIWCRARRVYTSPIVGRTNRASGV